MRRWIIERLVPVALAVSGVWACKEAPADTELRATAPVVDRRATVLFLGDSLTAGHGLRKSEALPALIQKRADAAGLKVRIVNAGRSGDTTAGGLSRLDWYFEEQGELAAVVIGLGSNDAMRGLPVDQMATNLEKIIQRVHAKRPKAEVFLWALRTFPNLGPEYVASFEKTFPRVAKEQGAHLIPFPLQDVAGNSELNQPDGIHPTPAGTELVAERVWSVLQTYLRER